MLKINLLPAYIYERRKVRKMMALFGVLFAFTLLAIGGWYMYLLDTKNNLTTQVETMEAKAQQVTALEAKIQTEKNAISGTKAKTDYIEAVMDYNVQCVKLYEELAKYTYSRISYSSVTLNGSSLAISAHARTLGDCGRYLLNMYRATGLFSAVSINAVPGWTNGASGAANGFDFTVSCSLIKPITAPSYAGAGAAPTTSRAVR